MRFARPFHHMFAAFLLALFIAATTGCAPLPGTQVAETPPSPQVAGIPDAVAAQPSLYTEQHRPGFHFTPPEHWMNDPNGMFYYEGEYHLFYQYYPGDTVWGPMHWGHAVSTDLVHWQHLPVALYPDELGYIFSGSAVVDWRNSSGLGRDGKPPIVAIFTYHNPELAKAGGKNHEYQGIAYSNDRGRTWTKYHANPVLPNTQKLQDFRDPKVFWHRDSQKWVMALSANDHVQLWGSTNLTDWDYLSEFGRDWGAHAGVWECPDLVRMTVAGSETSRWVLILNLNPGGPQGGSGTQYFVGDFDGKTFVLDESFKRDLNREGALWLDTGADNYAGVTWSDVPASDDRKLFIGWMSNWQYAQVVPTDPWRSAMTLPRTLTLHKTPAGYRVFSQPVRELQNLRIASRPVGVLSIAAGESRTITTDFPISQSELVLEFKLPAVDSNVGIELSNDRGERYRFGYDSRGKQFYSDRTESGDFSFSDEFARVHYSTRLTDKPRLKLHVFIDAASMEVFADGGANVMTDTFFPTDTFNRLEVFSRGEGTTVMKGTVYRLSNIWD